MLRDIDYAAATVRKQISEKFGHKLDLTQLEVHAGEHAIFITDGDLHISGSRDDLLAALRDAKSYSDFYAAAAR
ncbi:MAG: hypothetical protein AB7U73_03800 [Pirellulales bacterium]